MKIIHCEQKSLAWHEARLGKISSSLAWKLISSSGKSRTGKTPEAYLNTLLAERLTRKPTFVRQTEAMERGSIMENDARIWFEREKNIIVGQVGFALADNGFFGCSPDGIFAGGGLEIKCPGLPVFMEIATTHELPEAHYVQVQTCMEIFDVDQWYYLAYTDVRGLMPMCINVPRDLAFCEKLRLCIDENGKELDRREAIMRKYGHGVPENTPLDMSDFERDLTVGEIDSLEDINPESI